MKRVISLTLLVSICILIGMLLGRKSVSNKYEQLFKINGAYDQLYAYVHMRNIALSIKSKNYDYAECNAEFVATVVYDSLQRCTNDITCRNELSAKLMEQAPEILNNKKMPFERKSQCIK